MTKEEKEELELYRKFLLFIWDATDFYKLVDFGAPTEQELATYPKDFAYLGEDLIQLQKEGQELVTKVEEKLVQLVEKRNND
jgi:hypothetical protein